MIRIPTGTADKVRPPLREVLGLPPSSGSAFGSTFWKRNATCSFASRLYELGVHGPGGKTENLDVGDAFHLGLEAYYRALQRGESWGSATKCAWDLLGPLQRVASYADIESLLERMLTSYFEYAEKDTWRVIAVEEELLYRDAGLDYSTRLDLVVADDDGMWIVEHKSAKVITDNMMTGYLLDLQTLGQIWMMHACVDLTKYPPFKGVLVNMTSKQKTARHERVKVVATNAHLAMFEASLRQRKQQRAHAASLGYPRTLGNCSGPAQYFGVCTYFDLCHGRPDFSLAGVDKLTTEDLPFGFTVNDD